MQSIRTAYALSPVQEEVLAHSLAAPHDTGVYTEQFVCRLEGELDIGAFLDAWRSVVLRHDVLRTSIRVKTGRPEQAVHASVEVPVEMHDWRSQDASTWNARLGTYLEEDRNRAFSLTAPPLFRLALIRLDDQIWQFVFSFHHMILDGWSYVIVLEEVFDLYAACVEQRALELPGRRPFADYIAWRDAQDPDAGKQFWQEYLKNRSPAMQLTHGRANRLMNGLQTGSDFGERQSAMSPSVKDSLRSFARRHRVTLGTVFHGAWALLLSRHTGRSDIVFGARVTGRPAALADVESMVGTFINTLPIRINTASVEPLGLWFQKIQRSYVEVRDHDCAALPWIQKWCGLPDGESFFDSLVVFDAVPPERALASRYGGLDIRNIRFCSQTNHPVTLFATPEPSFRIQCDRSLFGDDTVEQLASDLDTVFEGIATNEHLAPRMLVEMSTVA